MAQSLKVWSVFGELGLDGLGNVLKQLDTFNTAGSAAAGMLRGVSAGAVVAGAGLVTAGLGLSAFALNGIQNFMQFDEAMTKSVSIMDDVTETMRGEMELAAREMAKNFRVSATQAAEAFYFLASAGMTAAQSIQALPAVTQFAAAGDFQLERATELLADSHAALGLRVADAEENLRSLVRVSDVLVKANILATGAVEDFAEALTNKAAARMRQLNMDVEEGVAILAAYAQQGAKGRLAGERLSIVLRDLPRIAVTNAKAFERFQIEIFDAAGNMNNFADIAEDFERVLGGLPQEQVAAVLAQLQMNEQLADGVTALIGMSGELRRFESELRNAGGVSEEVANKQLSSIAAQWDLLKQKVTDADYALGASLENQMRNMLEWAHQTVDNINWAITTWNNWIDRRKEKKEAENTPEAIEAARAEMTHFERQGDTVDRTFKRVGATIIEWLTGIRMADSAMSDFGRTVDRMNATAEEKLLNPAGLEGVVRAYEDFNEAIRLANQVADAEWAAQVEDRIGAHETLSVREESIRQAARDAAAWARELRKIQAEIGVLPKTTLLDILREEAELIPKYTDEWKKVQRDIVQTEHRIAQEAEEAAERARQEMERYAKDRLAYELQVGKISLRQRLADISEQLAITEEGTRAELDLLQEQYQLRRQLAQEEMSWMRYRIQIGEMSKEERIRQINEETVALQEAAKGGTREELDLLIERNELASQLTNDRIREARELARENVTAARAVLEEWRNTLIELGALTPTLEAEINNAAETIGDTVKDTLTETERELRNLMEGIGRSMIQGLIRGSLDMRDILESVLSSLLTSVVSRVAFAALGIASPSRVTMGWGRELMRGMMIGFESEAGSATSAMSRVSEDLLGTVLASADAQSQALVQEMSGSTDKLLGAILSSVNEQSRAMIQQMSYSTHGMLDTMTDAVSRKSEGMVASVSSATRDLMQGLQVDIDSQAGDMLGSMSTATRVLLGVMQDVVYRQSGDMLRSLSSVSDSLVSASGPLVKTSVRTGDLPQPVGDGLSEGIKLHVPIENMPKPLTPFEIARDAQWLEIFNQTSIAWQGAGGGKRRR